MDQAEYELVVPREVIANKIYLIRKQRVMLDRDLAELYGVETKQVKRAVRRNTRRFPKDFMFELTKEELDHLRCQIGASSWGGTRYMPMAFTEQGVAMLSSVLNSYRAIDVNISIMRIFTKMRELLMTHNDLLMKMSALEAKVVNHDERIEEVFDYLKQFIQEEQKTKSAIGFKQNKKG